MFAETPRLIIRDLQHDDLAGLLAISSDPDTVRMMDAYLPPDEAKLREWLDGTIWHNAQQPRTSHNCAILLKSANELIGWIGFGESSDPRKGDLDFGYALNRAHRNRGYMTEAVQAMLAYCFDVIGAHTVSASHHDFNPASGRVMQKAGMRLDDTMTQARADGEVYYVITAEDWWVRRHPNSDN